MLKLLFKVFLDILSSVLQTDGNLAAIPIGAAVVTDASFGAGRHVIDFQVLSGGAVLGAGAFIMPHSVGHQHENSRQVSQLSGK